MPIQINGPSMQTTAYVPAFLLSCQPPSLVLPLLLLRPLLSTRVPLPHCCATAPATAALAQMYDFLELDLHTAAEDDEGGGSLTFSFACCGRC